jgi:hypothetical protein
VAKKRKRESRLKSRRWWLAEEGCVHECLLDVVHRLVTNDTRRPWLELQRQLYVDEQPSQSVRDESGFFRPDMRTRWPALRSGCDTVHSKLGPDHARPEVHTIDGDWELSNAAEMRTQWLDGEIERLDLDAMCESMCLDGIVYGTGHIHVYPKHGRPAAELVYTGELFVDPREEKHRCVRSLYRVKYVDRQVLAEQFPDHADKIDDAENVVEPNEPTVSSSKGDKDDASDIVMVVEAWRLPSGPDAPGRHCICADGVDLADEPWEDDCFPFADFAWARDPKKHFGNGLAEQMMGPQAELNEIAETVSEAYHLMVPSVWVADVAEVTAEQITNEVGKVYVYKGGTSPPTLLDGSAAARGFAEREQICIQRVFSLTGVSEASASSQKPADVTSGKAMLVLQDVESSRFAIAQKNYERAHIQLAKLLLSTAERIAKTDGVERLSNLGGNDGLERIDWEMTNLGDAPYVIRVFPVSSLSRSMAGKLAEVEQMINAGLISDPAEARELLDAPDLKRYNSIESAGRNWCRKHVTKALRTGEATALHPYVPLAFFVRWATLSHDLAALKGCPESHLSALRDMIQMAIDMQAVSQPPPAPAAAPPMTGPPVPPAPMPPMPPAGGPAIGPPPCAAVPPGA